MIKKNNSQKKKIFISYRRSPSEAVNDLLFEKLKRILKEVDIFYDKQDITPSSDYRSSLVEGVLNSDLLLAIIDKNWHARWEQDSNGFAKGDEKDWVYIELRTAVQHNKKMLPIIVHPALDIDSKNIPSSIEELAYKQSITYYPSPDSEQSAHKIADEICKLLNLNTKKSNYLLLTISIAVLLVLLFSIFINSYDSKAYNKFETEVYALNLSTPKPNKIHLENSKYEEYSGQPDYSNFVILNDERIWDLRGFTDNPHNNSKFYSHVILHRNLRLIKLQNIDEIRFEARTTGEDIVIESVSHPDKYYEIIPTIQTQVAGTSMKIRQIVIDLKGYEVGEEIMIKTKLTYWDSLQTPEDCWVGTIGYPGTDYVKMTIVFPSSKPFKYFKLESAPNSREKPTKLSNFGNVLANKEKTALQWDITKPKSGFVFRLSWNW